MAYKDFKVTDNLSVRFWYREEDKNGNPKVGGLVWVSHGIWDPKQCKHVKVNNDYLFHVNDRYSLYGQKYQKFLEHLSKTVEFSEHVKKGDIIPNYFLQPIENDLFTFCAKNFVEKYLYNTELNNNSGLLALYAFNIDGKKEAINLAYLDMVFLPNFLTNITCDFSLNEFAVDMICCRSHTFYKPDKLYYDQNVFMRSLADNCTENPKTCNASWYKNRTKTYYKCFYCRKFDHVRKYLDIRIGFWVCGSCYYATEDYEQGLFLECPICHRCSNGKPVKWL